MKFSLVGPVYPYRGGIAHYNTQLALTLASRGHTVQVVSFKRQYPAWLYPGESDKDPSQHPLLTPAEYLLDPLYPWTWLKTLGVIRQSLPDRVVFNWWTTFWAPAYAFLTWRLRRSGIQVLFLVHNVQPHESRFFDRFLARLALGQAGGFITQTAREAERLKELFVGQGQIQRTRVQICPHPEYEMFSSQRIPQVEARRKLQLPGEGPVLLFFGIVRPYKGLEYLLEAIRRSALQGVNPYLIVAGEFWEQKQHYLEIIERLELKDRVRLDNRYIPDEEVADYFSAADLFVAPYVQGTQSGSAHLALGFGLPVVASLSIVDETLMEREGSQTWLAQPGDADSLAIAIRTALQAVQAGNIPKPQVATVGGWERLAQVIEEWE